MEDGKTGGISFFGLLTVVFIAFKLTNVISWSWFWVLSPIIIPFLIFIAGLFIFFMISFIISVMEDKNDKN